MRGNADSQLYQCKSKKKWKGQGSSLSLRKQAKIAVFHNGMRRVIRKNLNKIGTSWKEWRLKLQIDRVGRGTYTAVLASGGLVLQWFVGSSSSKYTFKVNQQHTQLKIIQ